MTMADELLRRLEDIRVLDPLDRQLAIRALGRCDVVPDQEPVWAVGIALAMAAIRDGHTCLEIGPDFPKTPDAFVAGHDASPDGEPLPGWPDPATWPDTLARCPLVRVVPGDGPSDRRLLVLDRRFRSPRLYLERYWDAEQRLVTQVRQRLSLEDGSEGAVSRPDLRPTASDLPDLRRDIEWLVPLDDPRHEAGVRDQRLALVQSIRHPFLVLTGGPGTGKTTSIAAWIALWLRQAQRRGLPGDPPLRVALLAPTGKAAARIVASIQEGIDRMRRRIGAEQSSGADWSRVIDWIPREAATVHRALGYHPDSGSYRHGPDHPLPVDLAVVDETSMLDGMLALRLLQALPDHCRVLWVGDRDQLASVQAGAVLGGLCRAGRSLRMGLSPAMASLVQELLGAGVSRADPGLPLPGPLTDAVAVLLHSFRTAGDSSLAAQIRSIQELDDCPGPTELVAQCRRIVEGWPLEPPGEEVPGSAPGIRVLAGEDVPLPDRDGSRPRAGLPAFRPETLDWMVQRWKATLDPAVQQVKRSRTREEYQQAVRAALEALKGFAVLCTHRQGPRGAEACTEAIRRLWGGSGAGEGRRFFVGQPLMVLANDYFLNLFNGDTGIVLPAFGDDPEDLVACFGQVEAPGFRIVPPSRIVESATAFAVTIHKAQGSEFGEVVVVTPREEDSFLTRELIYTAISRARHRAWIAGPRNVVADALARRTRRDSGLVDAFWPEG